MYTQDTATVTILENDDAAGVFSIAAISQGPLFIEETPTSVLQITIARSRGALTNVLLQYNIPGAENEIIGGSGLVSFVPNQMESNISLLINDDDIPETNETYTFSISTVDGNTDILGSPTSVDITILANDDYAGLFSFAAESSVVTVGKIFSRSMNIVAVHLCLRTCTTNDVNHLHSLSHTHTHTHTIHSLSPSPFPSPSPSPFPFPFPTHTS